MDLSNSNYHSLTKGFRLNIDNKDSFYRYQEEYLAAVQSIKDKLVFSSRRGLTYIAEILESKKISHKMVQFLILY